MNRAFLIFGIFIILTSCVSVNKYNLEIEKPHSINDLQRDVDMAYSKLQRLHPKLYQFISKERLDFKFDSLKRSIKKPMTSMDFYKQLAPVISEIKQGHISLAPPLKRFTKNERKVRNKEKFEFYDLEFEKVNDAFMIKANYGSDSTIVGSEVLAIGSDSITNLIKKYKKVFSSDGYNKTFQDRFIGLRFSGFYIRDYGYLDSLPITLMKNDSVFVKNLRTISKDSLNKKPKLMDSLNTIKIVKLTKEEKKLKKEKAKITRKYNKEYGYMASKKLYTRNFSFIGQDSTVAYMKIRNFNNGNYNKFYKNVFTKIDAAKTKNLIIDLRDNTGGSLSEISKLYSYLTKDNYQFVEKAQTKTRIPFLKSFISSRTPFFLNALGVLSAPITIPIELLKTSKKEGVINYRMPSSRKNKKPNELNFKGKIYVLINGNSFSASSILSTNLKATNRAIFVGEETGGHYNGTVAGVTKYIELPNSKVAVGFGLMQIQAPYQNSEKGYGIKPDMEIMPSKQDRILDVDPELNWILENIEQ